jgi:hypothetical protein
MAYPIPIDPAAFATLQNTLTPEGVLSYMERAAAESQKQLQQTTTAATQEAKSAGQDYLNAAQAPAPEPDALAKFVPSLLGNIASTISQDPSYRQQAQNDIAEKRQDLRQKRADNLLALKSMWDDKARLASQAGDREAEINARMKSEQLSKTVDTMLENQREAHGLALEKLRQEGDIATEKLRGANALEVAKVRANQESTDSQDAAFGNATYTTRAGNKFLDLTNFKTGKPHDLAVQYAAKNGMTPLDPNASTQMRTIDEVQNGLDQVESVLGRVLPHQTGHVVRDFLTRQAVGAKNAVQAASQAGSEQAAFGSTYPLAIRSLQAVAAGPGSGFRLNQSEINLIQQRWPRLNDNIETARNKLLWERWFLKNKENSYFKRDWRVDPEPSAKGLPATGILSGGTQGPARVKVKRKSDGRTGYINADDPDLKSGLFVRVP